MMKERMIHYRLQVWNRHHLSYIVESALAVLQRGTTLGTGVGRHIFRLVQLVRHLQRTTLMPLFPAGFPACRLTQRLHTLPSTRRLRRHISECCESIVSRINRISSFMVSSAFDMSVTFLFTGTKVRKISETTKRFDNCSFYI